MDGQEVIREFLIESHENLGRLDNEMIDLERRPRDAELLASIFRTVHTIKGTCGFLGFHVLEAVTHEAETILSQLRAGTRELDGALVSVILEVIDAVRAILAAVEKDGTEGDNNYATLVGRLKEIAHPSSAHSKPEPAVPTPPPAPAIPEPPPPSALPPTSKVNAPADHGPEQVADPGVSVADTAIRVDVGLLDKLMNLVGELVLARNQILQHNSINEDASLNATSQRLNLITTELQESVMKTRMQPIGVVWNKLPRVVRDIAYSFGKQIRLDLDGASTELDKTIIEAIKDPLTHLVRNSCDHGVERPEMRVRAGKPAQGRILLRAYHEGGQVNIEITDDGRGIDVSKLKQKALEKGLIRPEQAQRMHEREALNLIFHPGLSTADTVTNVSGRGVGMDVVKANIEKIGGLVDLSSRPGEGTTVRLKIPLTLAIIPGLVIVSGGERFVIPQVSLLELIRLEGESGARHIERVHGTPVYRRRGSLLPIAHLNEVLKLKSPPCQEAVNIVVLQGEDRQFGLVVDGIMDTQEIVVKPLGKQLKGLATYAGATIMGDGKVALILDVAGIGQASGVLTASSDQTRVETQAQSQAQSDLQRLLLFQAGSFERLAVPLSLVARLEEFSQSSIEQAGRRKVVQYRGRILPLVSLIELLDPSREDSASSRDPVQAIVFKDGDRGIGLLVDRVLDIIEDTVAVRQASSQPGLLGSAVIGNKVADFLDLHSCLKAVSADWFEQKTSVAHDRTVLLAEPSAFSRGLLRSGLELAGYHVVEAASAHEALRLIEQDRAAMLVTSLDLPPDGAFALLDAMQQLHGNHTIPALALTSGQQMPVRSGAVNFADYQEKFDWQGMIRSVNRLADATAEAKTVAECGSARTR
ncbi:MAG: chemotaxis protein CheW [Bryobacterales bacterium]|nr:chemotaxis protein CheW [Bryobacterales bacterium]